MVGRVATSLAKQGGWAILIVLLASCSGPFFSKVQVKATPSLNASLGSTEAEISSYISLAKVREMLSASPDTKVYDYQPDPNDLTQQYLIHYPLTTVELDFSQYLEDLGLDDTLSQSLDGGSFTIPSLDQTVSDTGEFDLHTELTTQVNNGFLAVTTDLVETGQATPQALTLDPATVTINDFDEATFSAGTLTLTFDLTNETAGLVLQATSISLRDGANVITSTATPVDLTVAGATANLNLAGRTLPSTFDVVLTVSTQGGVPNNPITISATPSLSGVTLSSASGITLDVDITVPDVEILVDDVLVSAVVATGSIEIQQAPLPDTWTSITRTTTITLSQTGGLNLTSLPETNDTIHLELNGETINNNPITVSAVSTVSVTNGSVSGLAAGPLSVGVDAVVSIGEFDEITVEPGPDFKTVHNFAEPLSQQLIDWVDSINFDEVGVEFSITNNLPVDNPMEISLSSTAFGIVAGTPISIPSNGVTTTAAFTRTPFTLVPDTVGDSNIDGKRDLDFQVTLVPESYDGTSEMTLYNIIPGTSLSLTGTATLVADWTTATVTPNSAGSGSYSGTFPSNNPADALDLGLLKDYLGDNIDFATIPGYFYLSGPNASMDVNVAAKYTDPVNGAANVPLINETGLAVAATGPTLPAVGVDVVTTPWLAGGTGFALEDVLNAKPSDLTFAYDIDVGTFVVNKADGGTTQLRAELVLILPLSLVAGTGASIDLAKSIPTGDLFGRSATSDNKAINDALKSLSSMTLRLEIDNSTGLGGDAKFGDKLAGLNEKTLSLAQGLSSRVITLNRADIDYIVGQIPFEPTLRVDLPDPTYSLRRGGGLTAKIKVSSTTNIDQTFDVWGNN